MHIFDPSAVRRSVCVIQWGLRTFEIQLDLSGEPVLTTQSTIELTEQENACILMVQCVFYQFNGQFVWKTNQQVFLRLSGGQPMSLLKDSHDSWKTRQQCLYSI